MDFIEAIGEEQSCNNNISLNEVNNLDFCLNNLKNGIDKYRYKDCIRYCNWIKEKIELNLLATEQELIRKNDKEKHHPIKPKRGDIFLTQLGENIGKEINDKHLVLIIQNNRGNLYSNTVVCVPLSGSGKLYSTHEKIEQEDIQKGRLDKLPSKAKTEQIHYIDKARLVHKVAELNPEAINRICNRIKKNLDM